MFHDTRKTGFEGKRKRAGSLYVQERKVRTPYAEPIDSVGNETRREHGRTKERLSSKPHSYSGSIQQYWTGIIQTLCEECRDITG